MESPLSEDEMAEVKKEALEKLRPYLCDKVLAERHFDLLRAKKILSKEDTEEISHVVGTRRKAGKLLDHLMENPKGLDTLVASIRREGTQNFLVQKITDEVQRIKNDKLFQKGVFSDSGDLSDEASKTNNLSQFSSTESNASKGKGANILFHPEGEFSPLPSACPSYCPLPSAPCPSYCPLPSAPCPSYCPLPSSLSLVKLTVATLPTTTSLPRPGDPGAPPLPPDLEPPPTGPPNTTTDSEFLPLRSRSP